MVDASAAPGAEQCGVVLSDVDVRECQRLRQSMGIYSHE